jgi:hypothetical protein
MSDEPPKSPPTPPPSPPSPPPITEVLPSVGGAASGLASANAPFIYFDVIGTHGTNPERTVANISLEVFRHMPVGTASIADRVIVAHLRMPFHMVAALRATLDAIELLAKPVAEGPKN